MFLVLLAFLIWLFATGNYSQWAALLTTSEQESTPTTSSSTTGSTGASSTATSPTSALNSLSSLASMGSGLVSGSGSENSGASGSSTPDDLIGGFTG